MDGEHYGQENLFHPIYNPVLWISIAVLCHWVYIVITTPELHDQFDIADSSTRLCMNAATYYGELIDWILSHVTDADMFLVQSAVTCCALFWFV
jgi:hypothetical protein